MNSLSRDLRKQLENAVRQARRAAEAGAGKAVEHLSVGHHEPRGHLTPEQRQLRNRLRARARQLGDPHDSKKGGQGTDRLVEQCAYEQWHRILFARFLAENDLLIHPPSGQAISLQECRELASGEGKDWLTLASEYAVVMLPQVFRADDAVLELVLPPESRQELEELLESLPADVFSASDSLGWTYQFWQADQKDAINASEKKIGAEELGPVTQLFTEDYMVDFLLHNTIGAWWAGKQGPVTATTEEEARAKVGLKAWNGLPAVTWDYLRFLQNEDGTWRPAAGTFDGWPKVAAEVTVLDPCMGSGHFLVFALPLLARLRAEEEQLHGADTVVAVLRDNLHGLELDERCTQIAAFNLALGAWRLGGYQQLPALHLACSGLSLSAEEKEWVALAKGDVRLEAGMKRLHQLFKQAPVLGSLIDPRADGLNLLEADFSELTPLLEQAAANAGSDETTHERAVTAWGLAKAAETLADQFTLVATNVPFKETKQLEATIQDFIQLHYADGRVNLATAFVLRIARLLSNAGTAAIVTPHEWLFLTSYAATRQHLLTHAKWNLLADLGEHAFESTQAAGAFVALLTFSASVPSPLGYYSGLDATEARAPLKKASVLAKDVPVTIPQADQLKNPDFRIGLSKRSHLPLLSNYAGSYVGLQNGDTPHFVGVFWELPSINPRWELFQLPCESPTPFGGREGIVKWEKGVGELAGSAQAYIKGREAWGRQGVAIRQTRTLPATHYTGDLYDQSSAAIVPFEDGHLPALWAYCESRQFHDDVRKIDKKKNVTNATLVKVPFDLAHWQQVAAEKYPEGLPKPFSSDPTQWLFDGHPARADQPLQVAVARLVGYEWPRQTGSSFPDCPALGPDGLESHADADGIVCLPSLKGEATAAGRLRELLAASYGEKWSQTAQSELLVSGGSPGGSLEAWLQDSFFEQHCKLFHNRPFVWHVWDGLRDGFSALVNYHKLAAPNGGGRRTLEKLTHTYLGDWISRQRVDIAGKVDGAETRLAAAEHLKTELEKILAGEPPYDLFVRWKPLHEQAIGWDPDINDGVRLNIRPFMTARPYKAKGKSACILRSTPSINWGPNADRGKEPERAKEEFPWFWGWDGKAPDFAGGKTHDGKRWNDLHYSNAAKQTAREATAKRGGGKGK